MSEHLSSVPVGANLDSMADTLERSSYAPAQGGEGAQMSHPVQSEAVWVEFHHQLRKYIRARVATDSDAEDILQEVFIRVQESARRATSVSSVSGWVYRITRNAIVDYHRARSRAAGGAAELAEDPTVEKQSPARERTNLTSPEVAQFLEPLVARLPEQYGQAVALTDLHGVSQVEAARRLGLSNSGMKSRVQRGREKLKALLLQCCQVETDARGSIVDCEPRERDDDDDDYGCC